MSERQPALHHTAQIIQFAAVRPKLGKRTFQRSEPVVRAPLNEEGLTDTCQNQRIRQARYEDWRKADAVREYWRAKLKMDGAIERVQHHGLPEGDRHPQYVPKSHFALIPTYREAIVAQLLTPAPTAREITWKRAVFKHGDHKHIGVNPERIERAIADDVEFLKAHPTRRKREAIEKRREWKAAFRARVTLYAEQNGIDQSELDWLGRLKHEDIAAFADRHRIRYGWLLEGEGAPTN